MKEMELLASMQGSEQLSQKNIDIKLALGTGQLSFSEKFTADDILEKEDLQLAAVYYNGLELEHISDRSLEVIKVALLREPQAKKFLTTAQIAQFEECMLPRTYEDSDNVLDAIDIVRDNGLNIKDLPEEMRANEAVQKAAVFNNAFAFNYVINPGLEIVKLAWIKNKGVMGVSGPMTEELLFKATQDPVMLKIYMQSTRMSESFELASEVVKNDPIIVHEFLSSPWHGPSILRYVGDDVKKNRALVAHAVFNDHTAAQFAHPDLLADREYIMQLVQINGLCLGYLPFEYRRDDEVVRLAKESDSEAVKFSLLPQDLEFVMLCGTSDMTKDKSPRGRSRSDTILEEEYDDFVESKPLPSSPGIIDYGIFARNAFPPSLQRQESCTNDHKEVNTLLADAMPPSLQRLTSVRVSEDFKVANDCLLPPKLQRHESHLDAHENIDVFGAPLPDEKNINTENYKQSKY
ncbi:MAG: DUF4116 domain-containing protein [Legionellales bacterium]|jgi:hypothetical protein|nr:DUF4116 domain-containing protein [Legionellales bacterium]